MGPTDQTGARTPSGPAGRQGFRWRVLRTSNADNFRDPGSSYSSLKSRLEPESRLFLSIKGGRAGHVGPLGFFGLTPAAFTRIHKCDGYVEPCFGHIIRRHRRRNRASRLMCWLPTGCALTARQRPKSACRLATSGACARTIGPRIRINQLEDESARCSVSKRPDQPNDSCLFTPPSKTRSTSNAISHPAARSASSETKRSGRGEPPPRLKLS